MICITFFCLRFFLRRLANTTGPLPEDGRGPSDLPQHSGCMRVVCSTCYFAGSIFVASI